MQDPYYSQQPQIRYAASVPQPGYGAGSPQVVQVGSGYGGGYSLQGGAQTVAHNQYGQAPMRTSSTSGTQPVYQAQPASPSQPRIVMTPQQSAMVVQPKSTISGRPSYPEHVTLSNHDESHYSNSGYHAAPPSTASYYQQPQAAAQHLQPQYMVAQEPQDYYPAPNSWSNSQQEVLPKQAPSQQVQPKYKSVQQMASTVAAHSNMRRSATGGSVSEGERFDPPRFLMPLDPQVHLREGDPVSFTTKVAPFGDSTLSVEWFKNGTPLSAGSRINTNFQRGFAILDILYTFAEDSGTYYCVAKSRSGVDQSSSCFLQVDPDAGVVHETQLPDDEMIQNLAAMEDTMYATQRRPERFEPDPSGGRPPQFLKPLGPQQVTVRENGSVHLETRVAPAGDPNLVVEWFKNGRPLNMGCRFTVTFDRGFAILDILYAYPEDSGQYFCIAKNSIGQAESNVVTVKCLEGANIITHSALPPESVQLLQNMDAPGEPMSRNEDVRYQDEEEVDSAPNFDVLPETQTVPENGPARFLVKISGHPRPEVIWLQNDEQLTVSSQYRIYHDGAINYLEFYRCNDIGRSQIRVIAQNTLGQVYADAELLVIPANDFRPELRHIVPENPFKRMVALKKVGTTPELENAFKRPKGHVEQIVKIQKNTEMQTRNFKTDVEEAENLYLTIQSRLRSAGTRSSVVFNQNEEEEANSFQEAQELQRKLQQQQQQRMQQHLQQQQHQQQHQQSQLTYQVTAPPQQMTNFQPQSFTIAPQQQKPVNSAPQPPTAVVEEPMLQKVAAPKKHSQPQRMLQAAGGMPPPQEPVIQEYEVAPAQQVQQHEHHHLANGHHAISYQSPPSQGIISMPVLSDCADHCSVTMEPQPAPHVQEEVIEPFKAAVKPKWNIAEMTASNDATNNGGGATY